MTEEEYDEIIGNLEIALEAAKNSLYFVKVADKVISTDNIENSLALLEDEIIPSLQGEIERIKDSIWGDPYKEHKTHPGSV